jgi:hypothetical protein
MVLPLDIVIVRTGESEGNIYDKKLNDNDNFKIDKDDYLMHSSFKNLTIRFMEVN